MNELLIRLLLRWLCAGCNDPSLWSCRHCTGKQAAPTWQGEQRRGQAAHCASRAAGPCSYSVTTRTCMRNSLSSSSIHHHCGDAAHLLAPHCIHVVLDVLHPLGPWGCPKSSCAVGVPCLCAVEVSISGCAVGLPCPSVPGGCLMSTCAVGFSPYPSLLWRCITPWSCSLSICTIGLPNVRLCHENASPDLLATTERKRQTLPLLSPMPVHVSQV